MSDFDLDKLRSLSVLRKTPQSATERRWARDMPAYLRLRQQGLQPPSIDGAARLESQGAERFEIEHGRLATNDQERRAIKEAIERGTALQLGEE